MTRQILLRSSRLNGINLPVVRYNHAEHGTVTEFECVRWVAWELQPSFLRERWRAASTRVFSRERERERERELFAVPTMHTYQNNGKIKYLSEPRSGAFSDTLGTQHVHGDLVETGWSRDRLVLLCADFSLCLPARGPGRLSSDRAPETEFTALMTYLGCRQAHVYTAACWLCTSQPMVRLLAA